MCTVSWLIDATGYDVCFNRDEMNTRLPAQPPCAGETHGVRFIAPRDGVHGGSWLGVNEHGVAVGLLNLYDEAAVAPPGRGVSRGLLLLSFMDCQHGAAVGARLRQTKLRDYLPFILATFAPDSGALAYTWDGRALAPIAVTPARIPLSSSSFDTTRVVAGRRRFFSEMLERHGHVQLPWLLDYHRSHIPGRGPYSVCMHRDDAHTVSFSHIAVRGGTARIEYRDGPPCEDAPPATAELVLMPKRAT